MIKWRRWYLVSELTAGALSGFALVMNLLRGVLRALATETSLQPSPCPATEQELVAQNCAVPAGTRQSRLSPLGLTQLNKALP